MTVVLTATQIEDLAANEEVERLRDAMKNAASEGVQQALAAVERDFRSNGKLRRLLGI
ncbi:hypothetical protein OGW08_02225 [Citrobacter sp. Cf122]|uniref:hypothetical protein n=1 Tax=Citrobacter sp. Cf122 TaxID=2985072 RepID=UPI00257627E9|nr:hypothetical protein [Citrobacter sp. Cf122]MDM3152956.1 hypothetical protein [Citrobacter sp. Cf122]